MSGRRKTIKTHTSHHKPRMLPVKGKVYGGKGKKVPLSSGSVPWHQYIPSCTDGMTRAHHCQPGKMVLQKIRKYQNLENFLIRNIPFQQWVRAIIQEYKSDFKIRACALETLQEASEAYLIGLLYDSNSCAILAK